MESTSVVSIGWADEVDYETEVDCVFKRKTSDAIPTSPLPPSFQHCIIHTIHLPSPHFSRLGSTTSTTIFFLGQHLTTTTSPLSSAHETQNGNEGGWWRRRQGWDQRNPQGRMDRQWRWLFPSITFGGSSP